MCSLLHTSTALLWHHSLLTQLTGMVGYGKQSLCHSMTPSLYVKLHTDMMTTIFQQSGYDLNSARKVIGS